MKIIKRRIEHGQLLIEVLVAVAIFSAIIIPFILSLSNLIFSQTRYHQRVQAANFAREGLEITYNIAANTTDWNNFVATHHLGTFYPSTSGELELIRVENDSDGVIEGKFTERITIAKVWRDNESDEIVNDEVVAEDLRWEDKDTLEVISKVSWPELGEPKEVEFATYLINLEIFGG